jgi:hypothetical protein
MTDLYEGSKIITSTRTVRYFKISVIQLILFKSVHLMITLFDADEQIITNEFMELETTEYDNWAADDNYVVNLVKFKYDLD